MESAHWRFIVTAHWLHSSVSDSSIGSADKAAACFCLLRAFALTKRASGRSESLKTSFRKRLGASSSLMAHYECTQHGDIETVRTSLPLWATAHEDDFPNELLIVSLSFRAGMFFPKVRGTNSIAWPQSPISHMLGASGGANMMAGILGHKKSCQTRDAPSIVCHIMKACFIDFGGSLYRSTRFR